MIYILILKCAVAVGYYNPVTVMSNFKTKAACERVKEEASGPKSSCSAVCVEVKD